MGRYVTMQILGLGPMMGLVSAFIRRGASLVAQMVKSLPSMQETQVQSLGWKDSLEESMATHCSILARRIPWTEEPGRHSPWGRTESDTTERLSRKETPESSSLSVCPHHPLGTQQEGDQKDKLSLETKSASILILDCTASRTFAKQMSVV